MERKLFPYIFRYSKGQQITLLIQTVVSFPFLYYQLDLPKTIVNQAIGGKGVHFPISFWGLEIGQIPYLILLCSGFLILVAINGGIKWYNNVYKGIVSERMLRRFRYQLIQLVMRFPLPQFRKMSQGEIVAMIASETEPLGGFVGDALAVPAYNGGTLLVIIFFMFIQDWVMGLAAISLYPIQGWIIPKLQRRVNLLSKERVRRMRNLSDRIGAIVQGAGEIHTHDTSRYELTDFTERQGIIYWIRVDIFNKKFEIKFWNNFLAQLTPFFFYLIGGYLVIEGELTLGALVAALTAYKDMTAPWKELLAWYQQFQDIRLKYEQLIEQFEPTGMIEASLQTVVPEKIEPLSGDLVISNLVWQEDEGTKVLNGASLTTTLPRHVALIGPGSGGKEELSKLLSRQLFPTGGRITIGQKNLAELPEAVTGRRMGYVGADSYTINGTIKDNILYGLKHMPLAPADYDDKLKPKRKRDIDEALASGSSPYDINAEWVDYQAAGCTGPDDLIHRLEAVLALVDLRDDVYDLGLRRTIDPKKHAGLVDSILKARSALRERLKDPAYANLVETIDASKYNTNASVAENILFGTPVGATFDIEQLSANKHVLQVLDSLELTKDFLDKGRRLAEMMVELFQDLPPGHEYFERFSFINSDDLPEFQAIVRRTDSQALDKINEADRAKLMALPFKLVHARHHLDLIDEAWMNRLLEARRRFAETLPENLRDQVQFFDPAKYNAAATILNNILFGKVAADKAQSAERVGRLVSEVIDEMGLRPNITDAGFGYDVGIAGSRLTLNQRQKLALARGLMKRPDILIVNQAITSLEPGLQQRILENVKKEMEGRSLFWVGGQSAPAVSFDQIFSVEGGRVMEAAGGTAERAPVAAAEAKAEEGEATGLSKSMEALAALPLFAGLDRSKLKFLAFTAGRVSYDTGQVVFKQGDPGDNAYVIVEGEVEVVLATPDGEKVLGTLRKNEVFGELALLSDSPRTATIRAHTGTTLLTISKELFVGLINEDAQVGSKVVRAMARRFEGTMSEYSRAKVMYDSATELPTMSLFGDRYRQAVAQFKRVGRKAVMLVFALDAPPEVRPDTDTQAYNETIKVVVERLRRAVRETDTIGLLGNFEFGVIMNEVDNDQAPEFLARRITVSLAEPIPVNGKQITFGQSIRFRLRPCKAEDFEASVEAILHDLRNGGAQAMKMSA
jgi:putative ABC transport system ATP-binding protein